MISESRATVKIRNFYENIWANLLYLFSVRHAPGNQRHGGAGRQRDCCAHAADLPVRMLFPPLRNSPRPPLGLTWISRSLPAMPCPRSPAKMSRPPFSLAAALPSGTAWTGCPCTASGNNDEKKMKEVILCSSVVPKDSTSTSFSMPSVFSLAAGS